MKKQAVTSTQEVAPTPQVTPHLEIRAERAAVCSDSSAEMHILVRVVPPMVRAENPRPPLNLALVLDRSGSMQGEKLRAAKAAAACAVSGLEKEDHVSVTIFDNTIETIVPSVPARDKAAMLRAIDMVQCSGTTALHAGWVEGGMQATQHLDARSLNRVILLTDGLANEGETNPDRICSDVKGLSGRGISTTAMGVGEDFNEDLLEMMARAGDGNYYFIEGAADLERIFALELQGLSATFGHTVSLGIEPRNDTRVEEVLNDLEHNKYGRLLLPNLISGKPIDIVFRVTVPAQDKVQRERQRETRSEKVSDGLGEVKICTFRLAWTRPDNGEREVLRISLRLPVVDKAVWQTLPEDTFVGEQVAHKTGLRIRARAIESMNRGDFKSASVILGEEAAHYSSAAPAAAFVDEELNEVAELQRSISEQRHQHTSKLAKFGHYRKTRGR